MRSLRLFIVFFLSTKAIVCANSNWILSSMITKRPVYRSRVGLGVFEGGKVTEICATIADVPTDCISKFHLLSVTPRIFHPADIMSGLTLPPLPPWQSMHQITLFNRFQPPQHSALFWFVISINGCYDVQLNFNYSIMNGATVGSNRKRENIRHSRSAMIKFLESLYCANKCNCTNWSCINSLSTHCYRLVVSYEASRNMYN